MLRQPQRKTEPCGCGKKDIEKIAEASAEKADAEFIKELQQKQEQK